MHIYHSHHVARNKFKSLSTVILVYCIGISLFAYLTRSLYQQPTVVAEAQPVPATVNFEKLEQGRASVETVRLGEQEPIILSDKVNVPIIQYHGIGQTVEDDGLSVDVAHFLDQLVQLHRAGWHTVTLQEAIEYLQGTRTNLPNKSFVITFDDGRKDSYYFADPILEKLGFTATMFVITDKSLNAATTFYLNADELTEMVRSARWNIESHAQSGHDPVVTDNQGTPWHYLSSLTWQPKTGRLEVESEYQNRIAQELEGVQKDLQQHLNVASTAIAFPFGDYGQDSHNYDDAETIVLSEARKRFVAGLVQVRHNTYSQNTLGDFDFLLYRLTVQPNWSGTDLVKAIESGQRMQLPNSELFENPNNYRAIWGVANLQDQRLKLSPADGSTSVHVVRDGTAHMSNYQVLTTQQIGAGSIFSIIGHYVDEKNYLSCNYSEQGVSLHQHVNGVDEAIAKWSIPNLPLIDVPFTAGIYLEGNRVRCIFDGRYVIKTLRTAASLSTGGFALQTWNPKPNMASAQISSIQLLSIEASI